ncbi:MAG: D-alanyl-D-alanine carboxypeptidase/D-alanyl-D-alanine-endopeptidase, partial [Candidatus Brocadiae bacterium]|nr:D-alanyl-D-alanine carboxypeptidase/D-alanyl-D-alanine-endopeptidase [Candidatus Brocadiia bacterium]
MNRRAVVAAVWALAAAGTAAGQDLAADVERLLAKHRLGAAAVGVCAIRVKTGEILFAQREAETFPLASVTKVFTAAAALEVLGEGHEFPTRVWIERGAPGEAALVMVGGGDPGLSGRDHDGNPTAVFERWAADLKAAGIRKITGIALDETRFGADHVSDQWPKDQLHKWYAAPCGALSLNDGCVDITVSAGKAGEPAGVSLSPATEFVTIINKCVTTTDRKAHMISIWRQPGKNTIVIDGKFWTGGARLVESVTIDDPALYCATVFRETLARKGLETAGAGFHRLASPYPPPFEAGEPLITATGMKEALRVMLRRSQNFYAEQLLRAAGPAGGTFAEAAAAGKAALAPLGVAV